MGWGEGRVGQREWEKEERETEGGMGEGETYQVSGILFDGVSRMQSKSNHEVPQFRLTPLQAIPIWTDPSSTGLDLYIKPDERLHVNKLYNCSCWLWDRQSGLAATGAPWS